MQESIGGGKQDFKGVSEKMNMAGRVPKLCNRNRDHSGES